MNARITCDDSHFVAARVRIESAFHELGESGRAFAESMDSVSAALCRMFLGLTWAERWDLLQDETTAAAWWVVSWRVGRLYYLSCVGILPRLLPER